MRAESSSCPSPTKAQECAGWAKFCRSQSEKSLFAVQSCLLLSCSRFLWMSAVPHSMLLFLAIASLTTFEILPTALSRGQCVFQASVSPAHSFPLSTDVQLGRMRHPQLPFKSPKLSRIAPCSHHWVSLPCVRDARLVGLSPDNWPKCPPFRFPKPELSAKLFFLCPQALRFMFVKAHLHANSYQTPDSQTCSPA